MIRNVPGSFWDWCHTNSISRVFEVTFSYFSILGFLMNFRDFRVFIFGYKPQNKNPEITGSLYFWVCKVQMHMNLFFDHYFNFLGAKTEINKNELNLINLYRLEALKRQLLGTWLGIWLNHFETGMFQRAF